MKRSSQVALLLMGTMSVGAGAYALMPSENCQPTQPGITQPPDQQSTQCGSRTSGHSSYFGGSSSGYHSSSSGSSGSYLSQNLASGGSSATSNYPVPTSSSHTTSRGGFGSFASHFTGGG